MEHQAWLKSLRRWSPSPTESVAIAQTPEWGRAIRAVGGFAYAVFSPEEGAGGLVFSTDRRAFECVNGPWLSWDESGSAPRQLATFAMAVSRLSPTFSSLTLRPRWAPEHLERRLSHLPIQPLRTDRAATWIVPIAKNADEQLQNFSGRLRRTLRKTEARVRTSWHPFSHAGSPEELRSVLPRLHEFGRKRGFTVPELPWFEGLTRSEELLRFYLCSAELVSERTEVRERLRTDLLIVAESDSGTGRRRAHYLFGSDQGTKHRPSASVSTAAAAQLRALDELRGLGVQDYDLNGFAEGLEPDDPYYGVCRFKEQFGGAVERYVQPIFRIE